MDSRLLAAALAVFGVLLIVTAPDTVIDYSVGDVLIGLGVVFLLVGLVGIGLVVMAGRDQPPFPVAVAVAVGSALAVIASWIVYLGHPGTALTPLDLSWWAVTVSATPAVTIPVVAALVFPLALMETTEQRRLALGLLSIPLFVGVIAFIVNPPGFGIAFGVTMVGMLVVAGLVAGLPIYLLGEVISEDGAVKQVIFSHLDFGPTP